MPTLSYERFPCPLCDAIWSDIIYPVRLLKAMISSLTRSVCSFLKSWTITQSIALWLNSRLFLCLQMYVFVTLLVDTMSWHWVVELKNAECSCRQLYSSRKMLNQIVISTMTWCTCCPTHLSWACHLVFLCLLVYIAEYSSVPFTLIFERKLA